MSGAAAVMDEVSSSGKAAIASLVKLLEGLVQDCCGCNWRAPAGYRASLPVVNMRSQIITMRVVRNSYW
jgi:hypothetical protein